MSCAIIIDMHKKIFLFLILFSASTANYAFADTTATTNTTTNTVTNSTTGTAATNSAAATTAPNPTASSTLPPLIENIHKAKDQLQTVSLNYSINPVYKKSKKSGKKYISSYTLDAKDFALAILDPSSGAVEVTRAIQRGKTFEFVDPAFNIEQQGFNGVNTHFLINSPANGVVLAEKYLISGPEKGSKQSIVNSLSEAVYVPYSQALTRPDVVKYGEEYIDGVIKQAANQLANIQSQSVPGETLTEAIQPSIIKALVFAEHMDTGEFITNPDTQQLIDQLYTLYAANEGDTFVYSVSSAGARGIAQFVPSTYNALAKRHPEAGLIASAVVGLSNHVNSIKAEYLLIDDYIAAVHAKVPEGFNPAYVLDYGAASYNGGVARVAKAIKAFGTNWYNDHSSDIAGMQTQISAQNTQLASLKSQAKKSKDKTAKAYLNSQIKTLTASIADLKNQLGVMQKSSLKNETINYLSKMHRLVQIFNAENPNQNLAQSGAAQTAAATTTPGQQQANATTATNNSTIAGSAN